LAKVSKIYFKLGKCHFAEREVEYLDHILEFGSFPSPNKTKVIKDFPWAWTIWDLG